MNLIFLVLQISSFAKMPLPCWACCCQAPIQPGLGSTMIIKLNIQQLVLNLILNSNFSCCAKLQNNHFLIRPSADKCRGWEVQKLIQPQALQPSTLYRRKMRENPTQFMLIWFSTMFSLFIDFQQTLCGCWTDLLQRLEFPRSTVVLQICTKTDGFGWKSTQSVHKYTNTQSVYKYTNTQIHKFAQIHKCAQRRMVLVGKVHKVYKVWVQQPSELWPRGSPPHLHTGSTHPTFSERGSLMRREIVLKSRLFSSNVGWLFNNGLMPPKAGFRKLRM